MTKVIHAVFENGVFVPTEKIKLQDHQKIELIITDDIRTNLIEKVATKSKSFKFLKNNQENIYTLSDGKPI